MSERTLLTGHETVVLGALSGPARSTATREQLALEGFEILGMLGQGGMGVVYKARQVALSRTVALKMILAGHGASHEQVARFRIEAGAAARLQHPHIVQVHQVGEVDGFPYMALEYVEGPTLAQVWESRPQPARQAAEVVRTLARAIAHAHAHGVIHRDLKPENVLVGRPNALRTSAPGASTLSGDTEPVLKVVDFGLAKYLDEEFRVSRSTQVAGTPSYMAPEQAFGGKNVGAAADVYSLGAILYAALTGRPPFRGENELDTLDQVRHQEPVPPRQIQPRVPPDLDTICLKCLQKDPTRRYETADALAEDLRRFLAEEPIHARPVSTVERLGRWCRRHPGTATWVTVAFVTLALGALTATYFAFRAKAGESLAQAKADEAEDNRQLAQTKAEEADAQRRLVERRAYGLEINRAHAEIQEGALSLAQQRLRGLVPPAGAGDRRGFEWHYLDHLRQLELRTFTAHKGMVHDLATSPDGRLIASAGDDGTVGVWDFATGTERYRLRGHEARVNAVVFSPDGRWIVSGAWDDTIRIWDVASGKEERILHGLLDRVNGLAFSPDGSRFASAGSDYNVRVWDFASGRELFNLPGHKAFVRCVAFSRDGKQLASGSYDATIRLWDPATGRAGPVLEGHTAGVSRLAYSPDGKTLATVSDDQTARLWDPATGRPLARLAGHGGRVSALAFSPDGRRLATGGSVDGSVRVWDVATAQEGLVIRGHADGILSMAWCPDGWRIVTAGYAGDVKLWDAARADDVRRLVGHTATVHTLAYSSDGRRLASAGADGTVRLWDPTGVGEPLVLTGHAGAVRALAFSPKGGLLASAGADGRVRIWDAATGRELRSFSDQAGEVACLAFSPDGTRLAAGGADLRVHVWDAATGRELFAAPAHPSPLVGVAFTPDGRHLRVTGRDQSLKVWDAATGAEVASASGTMPCVACVAFGGGASCVACGGCEAGMSLCDAATGRTLCPLVGHTGRIWGMAFSGEGERLASASADGTVRLWDTTTGQELLTLREWEPFTKTPCPGYTAVAVSPDGLHVAAARTDAALSVWDAGPLTSQRRAGREARALLAHRYEQNAAEADVVARVRHDETIPEEVRREALALAGSYGRSLVAARAHTVVQALFAKPLFRAEVLDRLRTDPSLPEPVRQEALRAARDYPEDPDALWLAAWLVGRNGGASKAAYERALAQAEAAYRLDPRISTLEALGFIQYRLGRYDDARKTLTEVDRMDRATPTGAIPWHQAFLAMTYHRLGREAESKAAYANMQALMSAAPWATHAEAHTFRREAERVLNEPSGPPAN